MDFLFVLFFLFIAFNMFRNFVKAAAKGAGKTAYKAATKSSGIDPLSEIKSRLEQASSQGSSPWNGGGYEGDYGDSNDGDWSFGAPKTQKSTWAQRQKVAQKSSRKYKASSKNKKSVNFSLSGRQGTILDKNRQRRDDWGRRLQKDVLSGTNVVIGLIFCLIVLYVLSQF